MAKKKWFLLGALGVLMTILRGRFRGRDQAETFQPPSE